MIPASDAPLLALPRGSVAQFLLMTLPLLGVYLYFLWLAIDRKNVANPDDPRYSQDRIRLTDILYTYLATLVLFCSLAVYLLWFVSKRRRLSRRYEREAIVVLGDVEYDDKSWDPKVGFWANVLAFVRNGFTPNNNYGRVVYNLERVANHPACDSGGKELSGTVTKKVRVYCRYPRERVSLLVLPGHPRSGQPKVDMEADWASFSDHVGLPSELDSERGDDGPAAGCAAPVVPRDRSRSTGVLLVAAAWIAFLSLASWYVLVQIAAVEDYYYDETYRTARIVFWIVIGGGIPLVALGGNWARWKVYERWILEGGTIETKEMRAAKEERKSRKKKRKKKRDEQQRDEEAGAEAEQASGYVQMT